MSQAVVSDPKPRTVDLMAVVRAVVFVALLSGNVYPPVAGASLAVVGAVLAAPLVVWEVLRYLPRIHPAVTASVALLAPLILYGLLNAPTLEYGVEKFEKLYTVTLLSALAATLIRDRRGLRSLAWVWLGATLVLAVVTIVGGGTGARASTFDSNAVWVGREIAVGLLLAVWLMWRRALPAVLGLAALAVLAGALGATESRGPLLGVLAALVVLVVVGRPRFTQVGLAITCFATAGVIAVLAWAPSWIPDRFWNLLVAPAETVDTSRRNEFWEATWPVIEAAPSGVGFGNWSWFAGIPDAAWPHNLFIEAFAEAGWLVGGLLTLAVLAILVRVAVKAWRDPDATLVLMLFVALLVAVNVSGDLNARSFFAVAVLASVVSTWRAGVAAAPVGTAVAGSRSVARAPGS